MEKNQQILIGQILGAIGTIQEYIHGLTKTEFVQDRKTQDAVLMQLQFIGELSKGLSEEFRNSAADVPWEKIIGLRNVISHEYLGLDINRIWNTVENNLPPLQAVLEKIFK